MSHFKSMQRESKTRDSSLGYKEQNPGSLVGQKVQNFKFLAFTKSDFFYVQLKNLQSELELRHRKCPWSCRPGVPT